MIFTEIDKLLEERYHQGSWPDLLTLSSTAYRELIVEANKKRFGFREVSYIYDYHTPYGKLSLLEDPHQNERIVMYKRLDNDC